MLIRININLISCYGITLKNGINETDLTLKGSDEHSQLKRTLMGPQVMSYV